MKKKSKLAEIHDYDSGDSTEWINSNKKLKLSSLGYIMPSEKSTQVVSLRLPTRLINAIKSMGFDQDMPYHSLIKSFLWDRVRHEFKKGHTSF